MSEHYRQLESMFHAAPIQNIFSGASMRVEEGRAVYSLDISSSYFHAAEAMHGSVYFKLLDDAAYFAAASLEAEYFLLTKEYTIQFLRPVGECKLTAIGEVVESDSEMFLSESKIVNDEGKVVGQGKGVFVKSKKRLHEQMGYGENGPA